MEPSRTKLGAALARGLSEVFLSPGTDVLYLGAATGTTASHVADIVGPSGTVYAVEKSPRAFMRLLSVSKRWPNLAPLLKDARVPHDYLGVVPMVGAIYADISQPDQVAIVRENATLFLRDGGVLLFAVKLSSMGRERTEREHADAVRRELERAFRMREEIPLEPFYRKHVFLTATLNAARTPT
jgi:fibrillarin-like rRNA methylase